MCVAHSGGLNKCPMFSTKQH